MSLINNVMDIGELMLMNDDAYNEETNSYDDSLLEGAEEVDNDEFDDDVEEYSSDDDDELDIADQELEALKTFRSMGVETNVEDEVMDMIIDDEADDMDIEDIEEEASILEEMVEMLEEID